MREHLRMLPKLTFLPCIILLLIAGCGIFPNQRATTPADTSPHNLDLLVSIDSGTQLHAASIQMSFFYSSIPVEFAHGEKLSCNAVPFEVYPSESYKTSFGAHDIPEKADGYECIYHRNSTDYSFTLPLLTPITFTTPRNGDQVQRKNPLTITYTSQYTGRVQILAGNLASSFSSGAGSVPTPSGGESSSGYSIGNASDSSTGSIDIPNAMTLQPGPGEMILTLGQKLMPTPTIFHSLRILTSVNSSIFVTFV